ncbi:MAG: penicillin-binding transpeptidase domain-containing protein, partial [Halanaerobiales bacterium]
YQDIYSLLTEDSQDGIKAKKVESAFKNFMEEAGILGLEVEEITKLSEEFSYVSYNLKTQINSRYFPDNTLNYIINLKRERLINWKINWDYRLVYPGMKNDGIFRRERILAERGEIFDKEGSLLVGKGDVITVGVHPVRIKDRETMVTSLSEILELDSNFINKEIDRYSNNPDWLVPIKRLTENDYRNLEGKLRPIPGVVFSRNTARIYPAAESAAHLTGYMGEVDPNWIGKYPERDYRVGDRIGKTGLESTFEFELRGQPGYHLYLEREAADEGISDSQDSNDSRNIEKEIVMEKLPIRGEDIYLTLDLQYQQVAYQSLEDKTGSIILIDPQSGELLALSNNPTYDPNDFTLGMNSSEWEKLRSDNRNPMLNRALQGLYPPGSIMKIITSAAALDTGVVEPDRVFNDTGQYRVQGNPIVNFQSGIFEEHQFSDALINSINTTMAKVGLELGEDSFREYGEKFSFNKERAFVLPFKESKLGSLNRQVELAWAAIGQSEVLATPLQMALVTAVIAADGNDVQPVLIDKRIRYEEDSAPEEIVESNELGNQVIENETADIITKFMIGVVEEGSGEEADIPAIQIAGKTGTAEISSLEDKTHAWFASFAPADKPEFVMLVFLEKGGVGGQDAASVARDLWLKILAPRLETLEENKSSELDETENIMENNNMNETDVMENEEIHEIEDFNNSEDVNEDECVMENEYSEESEVDDTPEFNLLQ